MDDHASSQAMLRDFRPGRNALVEVVDYILANDRNGYGAVYAGPVLIWCHLVLAG